MQLRLIHIYIFLAPLTVTHGGRSRTRHRSSTRATVLHRLGGGGAGGGSQVGCFPVVIPDSPFRHLASGETCENVWVERLHRAGSSHGDIFITWAKLWRQSVSWQRSGGSTMSWCSDNGDEAEFRGKRKKIRVTIEPVFGKTPLFDPESNLTVPASNKRLQVFAPLDEI